MAKAKKKLTTKKTKSSAKTKPAAKAKAKTQPPKTAKPAKKTAKSVKKAAKPLKKTAKPAKPAKKQTAVATKTVKGKVSTKKTPATKKTSPPRTALPAKKAQPVNLSDYLTPLDDRVLIQIEVGERVTAGGLFIPDTATVTGNRKGWIVSVGPGHRDKKGHFRPLDVKVGDRVLFAEWAGTELVLGEVAPGAEFKILRETDLLGVVED